MTDAPRIRKAKRGLECQHRKGCIAVHLQCHKPARYELRGFRTWTAYCAEHARLVAPRLVPEMPQWPALQAPTDAQYFLRISVDDSAQAADAVSRE